ncbi:MAG: hypothetical protein Q9163_006323 [Psora crenata]
MASSRVFIKNLPTSLTVEDFRKHFSQQAPVTDAKLITHRRIGYVGYKTSEDASRAVKYFDKSFIGMARLKVELARSVDEVGGRERKRQRLQGKESAGESSSRTHEHAQQVSAREGKRNGEPGARDEDGKLQEFLQVMQPQSKSKTWGNQWQADDTGNVSEEAERAPKREAVVPVATISDDEYEHLPKKQKDLPGEVVPPESKLPSPPVTPAAGGHYVEDIEQRLEEPMEGVTPVPPSASDADWLRTRTSRLLGLTDEDEALQDHPLEEERQTKLPASDTQVLQCEPGVKAASYEDAPKADDTQVDTTLKETESTGNGRLFVRNLSYSTTEDDIRSYFLSHGYGEIEEVHLPVDSRTGSNKGFAHLQFMEPNVAARALEELDQKPFQGRLLHIMPSNAKKQHGLDEIAISKLPLKKQQQIKRKAEAASSMFNWNSMYMSSDAVMSSVSDRLKVAKSDLLDPTSSDAAVKQAHAETHVIQETKSYFASNGVDLDAFKKKVRGNTAILVKNFSYGVKPEELKKLFEAHGPVTKMLMPPSGTIAIVQFGEAEHAKSAFADLAYRKFKDSLLFLEKAPKDLFPEHVNAPVESPAHAAHEAKISAIDLLQKHGQQDIIDTSTLFVRNLNFSTTNERLHEVFRPLEGFLSARVKTKANPKKPGQALSMGFGFLEFQSKQHAQAAMRAMDGYKLDDHELLVRASHKMIDAAEERRKEDHAKKIAGRRTKIIIKNLPFEASKKQVRSLFEAYGQLRSVRVPKKFDSSTRGFAFAEFVTAKEAENAMDALRDTHLLGRRLVLEFAAEEETDPELEIEKMQQKMGKQTDKVALQRLIAGSGRKKFTVEGEDEL